MGKLCLGFQPNTFSSSIFRIKVVLDKSYNLSLTSSSRKARNLRYWVQFKLKLNICPHEFSLGLR
jgi:hypothetical protein